jgi:hypothetical protein
MGWVMPEIVVQKIIKSGMQELRENPKAFDDIFSQYTQDELDVDYGQLYIDKIRDWFTDPSTKIPVLSGWALNVQKVPSISVHLANESEDESKASLLDYAGTFDDSAETGTAVFTTMLDIGIHANRTGDQILWLYYIISYILFKNKLMAHRLGLKLQTYSASDYAKDANKMPDNVWTRWIRFRCTTENFWAQDPLREIEDVNTDAKVGLPTAHDISATPDVNVCEVDPNANQGIAVSSDDEDDIGI